jgi:CMP-N-acetylneuraminic acid synthetase
LHALKYIENYDKFIPKIIILLQPTSPLRKIVTINEAIKIFLDNFNEFDSLIPVYPIKNKIGTIENGIYKPVYPLGTRRQDLKKYYKECGTIYIFKPELIKKGNMFGEKMLPFKIKNPEEAIDIDSLSDLKNAEYLLRK